MALHKTNWQPIAWEVVNGVLTIMNATEHTIRVKDGKGAYASIDFIPSSEGVKGLGHRLSPSANQKKSQGYAESSAATVLLRSRGKRDPIRSSASSEAKASSKAGVRLENNVVRKKIM